MNDESRFYEAEHERIESELVKQLYDQLEKFSSVHEDFKQLTLDERRELIKLKEEMADKCNQIESLKRGINNLIESDSYHWHLYLTEKENNRKMYLVVYRINNSDTCQIMLGGIYNDKNKAELKYKELKEKYRAKDDVKITEIGINKDYSREIPIYWEDKVINGFEDSAYIYNVYKYA